MAHPIGHTTASGYGMKITVDSFGKPWVLATNNTIWQRSTNTYASGSWAQFGTYTGKDIGGGPSTPLGNFQVILSAMDDEIKEWSDTTLTFQSLVGYGVAVSSDNVVNGKRYAVAGNGKVFKYQ